MSTPFKPFPLPMILVLLLVSGPAAACMQDAGTEKLVTIVTVAVALIVLTSPVVGGALAIRDGRSVHRGMFAGLSLGLGGLIGLALILYPVFLFLH